VTCQELVEFLAAYLETDLGPAEAEEFERHMAMCEDCRNYVETYQKTVALEREAFEDPSATVPSGVPEDLITAILAARKQQG